MTNVCQIKEQMDGQINKLHQAGDIKQNEV